MAHVCFKIMQVFVKLSYFFRQITTKTGNFKQMWLLTIWPYVPRLVKIHWRMLILECSQGCYVVTFWPSYLDLWPMRLWPWQSSLGFQILLRTKYVPSLIKIHWRMNEVAKGYSNATVRPSHPCEHSRINILQWILTKLGTYLVLKRIWNPIDFQGQRSRSSYINTLVRISKSKVQISIATKSHLSEITSFCSNLPKKLR
jgi:hypothetical protein